VRNALVIAFVGLSSCGTSPPAFQPWDLETLTGDSGFTLRVPPFQVDAGRESQNCYFVQVPDLEHGSPFWIDRVVMGINPGSHHVNVFRVKTIINLDPANGTPTTLGNYPATVIEGSDDYQHNPCWDSANWADWPLVTNSQHSDATDPITDWQLPAGVALQFTPGEMLMVQTHYVNTTDQPTPYGARVAIDFYTDKTDAAPIEMGTLFATQQNIRICRSNPQVTYSGTCRFPNAVTIAAANGHFHKRGTDFRMYTWDGTSPDHPGASQQFYDSMSWDHPVMQRDLDVAAPANTGMWWDCAYTWSAPDVFTCADVDAKDPLHANDCCYTFGGNTDVGEHCNVFLYYYPRLTSDVFCL
jgi:hypothetical protein